MHTTAAATTHDAIKAAEAKAKAEAEARAAEEFKKREEELLAQIQRFKDADAAKAEKLLQHSAEMQKVTDQLQQMQAQRVKHEEELVHQGRECLCVVCWWVEGWLDGWVVPEALIISYTKGHGSLSLSPPPHPPHPSL